MKFPRLPENLVTPYQGFLILGTGGLLAALLWPDLQTRRTLFLQILAFLQGILAIQVGEAEHGYGPIQPRLRLARLAFFNFLALFLALPLVFVYRAETGAPWSGFLLATLFLSAHGFVWMGVGHGLAGLVRSDGVRFVVKYGGFILALFGPLFLAWPVSAFNVLPALWEGKTGGWPGFFMYLGLSGVSLGLWMRPRSCQKG
jgi:hypothetical protein